MFDTKIRRCRVDEQGTILEIINAAAERYRDVIPADCWHDPYMGAEQLARDVSVGVNFWGVAAQLLEIPPRQADVSVVLAKPARRQQ